MTSNTMTSETMASNTMRTRVVLVLTLIVFLTTGRAPGMRELRNPDAEAGWGRVAHALKRDLV